MGIKINGEALIGHRKISLLLFSSLINLCYPSEMHPSLQHLLIHFAIQYVDCHVQRVGIEKLSRIVEWAAKYLCSVLSRKNLFEPDPPRSLRGPAGLNIVIPHNHQNP